MSKKETLHIYRRVSTGEQSKKYSLGNQLEYGIKKSKKLEMDYQDWNEEGKSGSSEKIEDRIVLTRMYSQLQMGKIKHLFVYDLSRLSRNPMVSSLLRKEMEDNGVKLYTNESDVDFQKNEQVLMYDFISSISQFFVKVQREKSMVGKVSHFKKGGWRGGTFPFGYVSEKVDGVKRLVINPDESKWIRKIYDWYDNDVSTKEIGMSLDKNGVKPRRGKFWSLGSIQVILKNELYIGKDEMIDKITNPQKPITLYHTNPDIQIIDNETFSRVRIKVKNQQRIKNINTKVIHTDVLLRGKLFCESCGEIYGCRVKPKKNEYYYYCRSRENNWRKIDESKKVKCSVKKSINIKNTDKQVWNTIVELLGNSHIIKETLKENELINKKKDDEQRKDRLLELRKGKRYVEKMVNQLDSREKDNRNWFLSGEIDKKQYDDGMKVISDTREERFSELEQVSLDIQGVLDENKWIDWLEKHGSWIGKLKDGYTIDEKKEIISEYVSRILVSFDTSINQHRLKIHLKLPIVDDGYEVLTGGKNREYIIKNGKSYTDTLVDKVKSGRKKKDENVVICGDTQIPPINLTPSLWNDFDRGYLFNSPNNFYITCIVEITSPKYWVIPINQNQSDKYEIIKKMKEEGFTYLEISDYLNTTDYKPERTKQFSPSLVCGLWLKMNKRIKRLKQVFPPKIYGLGLRKEPD